MFCPKCKKETENYTGLEYDWNSPNRYDGVSEWHFHCCGTRMGRWSKKILKEGECEKRWGGE